MIKEHYFNTTEEEIELLNKKEMLGKSSILKYDEEFLFLEKDDEIEPIKIKTPIEKKEFNIENAFIINNIIEIEDYLIKKSFYEGNIEDLEKEKYEEIRKNVIKNIENRVLYYYSEDIERINELEDKKYLIRLKNINLENYYMKEYEDDDGINRYYKSIYFCLF